MPELKNPVCTEADRSDQRILTQVLLIVSMPAHTVIPIAVVVQQAGIESGLVLFFNTGFYLYHRLRPWKSIHGNSGIAIADSFISVKCGESGLQNGFTKYFNGLLFPGNSGGQVIKIFITFDSLKTSIAPVHLPIIRQPQYNEMNGPICV